MQSPSSSSLLSRIPGPPAAESPSSAASLKGVSRIPSPARRTIPAFSAAKNSILCSPFLSKIAAADGNSATPGGKDVRGSVQTSGKGQAADSLVQENSEPDVTKQRDARPFGAKSRVSLDQNLSKGVNLPQKAVMQPCTATLLGPAPGGAARSFSTLKSRLLDETQTSALRRSLSVEKSRESRQPGASPSRLRDARRASTQFAAYKHVPSPPRTAAAAGRVASSPVLARRSVSGGVSKLTEGRSLLHAKQDAALKPVPLTKPLFSLNLSGLHQPSPQMDDTVDDELSTPPVPKLNFTGILEQRAVDQASEPVFTVADIDTDTQDTDKVKRQQPPPVAAKEHYYLYAQPAPAEKEKVAKLIKQLPSSQQQPVKKLYNEVIEARQNCEQMIFRGHRLLDQAQAEYKTRLQHEREEKEREREEKDRYKEEVEVLHAQLAYLLQCQAAQVGTQETSVGSPAQVDSQTRASSDTTADHMMADQH